MVVRLVGRRIDSILLMKSSGRKDCTMYVYLQIHGGKRFKHREFFDGRREGIHGWFSGEEVVLMVV